MYITLYNWKQNNETLYSGCRDILKIKDCQLYYPIFSLFFNIYNNETSHKNIDFKRRYFLKEFINIVEEDEYNSNKIILSKILDVSDNTEEIKNVFVKQISILDTSHILLNHYNLLYKRNNLLPSTYNYITYQKINDMNNSSYIDCFFSYIVGLLNEKNINPSFTKYYGCVNGIGNHYLDISEEIDDFEDYPSFNKGLNKTHEINVYTNDISKCPESISLDSSIDNPQDNSGDEDSESEEGSGSEEDDDYIVKLLNIPVISLFIEKLDGTLEDYFKEDTYNIDILISCFFQISFALAYLQKHYEFLHNDLHINNIMYIKTKEEYLYYNFENKYFKIPTYGVIFKIIDFGRCIFKFKKKIFMNDAFSKYGEADTQYNFPNSYDPLKNKPFNPNFSFDLCRLSTTILDELNELTIEKNNKEIQFLALLIKIIQDKNGNTIYNGDDQTFQLYIDITEKAINGLPLDIINQDLYKQFLVSKNDNINYFSLD